MIDATTIIDYSFSDFSAGIDSIANAIKSSGWSPDYIVGIVRGGSIPAVFLSHKLNVPVQMVHWNTRDTSKWISNEHNCWVPEDINNGHKVLVADDIIDSGEALRTMFEDWQSSVCNKLDYSNIYIASLIYNKDQSIVPEYYGTKISRKKVPEWFTFWWEEK